MSARMVRRFRKAGHSREVGNPPRFCLLDSCRGNDRPFGKALKYFLLVFLFATGLSLLLRCSGGTEVAGTGNSTGNGVVAGIILHESGEPAADTEVKLLPQDFNPARDMLATAALDTTDLLGAYSVQGVAGAHYNVIAVHLTYRTRGFLDDIAALGNQAAIADTIILRRPGAAGVPLDTQKVNIGDTVFIPGTDIYAEIDADDMQAQTVVIDSIPAGRMRGARLHRPGGPPETIGDSADVVPGDTVDVAIPVDLQNLPKMQSDFLYNTSEDLW